MISFVITAVFAVAYLLVTVWLCRGVKLDTRAVCLGGVVCALTLVLATIRIPLPTGSNITCGSWIPLRRSTGPRSSSSSWWSFPAWATPACSVRTSGGGPCAA